MVLGFDMTRNSIKVDWETLKVPASPGQQWEIGKPYSTGFGTGYFAITNPCSGRRLTAISSDNYAIQGK